MSVQLFRLRGVPEDEAEEVRALLTDNAIDFYETPAGNWGISMPALWLQDEKQLQQAKALIANYQAERLARARDQYEQLKREGRTRTIVDVIKEEPIRFLVYLAIVGLVAYFSTKPFFDIGK